MRVYNCDECGQTCNDYEKMIKTKGFRTMTGILIPLRWVYLEFCNRECFMEYFEKVKKGQ